MRRADGLLQPTRKALATKRVNVSRGAVVKSHAACEGSGAQQDVEHRDRPLTVVAADGTEEDLSGGIGVLREFDGVLWTGTGHRHPGDEYVEQPDADDAGDGGNRDDLLRVSGLLAVHRRRLEPDPG